MDSQCHFEHPPPPRVYCMPAPFTRSHGGSAYHRVADAYGASTPHRGPAYRG